MRHFIRTFALPLVTAALAAVCVAGCPGPEYPKCEKDDQCKGHNGTEHCRFGTCQQCVTDEHCGADETCNGGRCEKKPAPAAPAAQKATPAPATTTAAAESCPRQETVHFEFNEAALTSQAQAELGKLATCFQQGKTAPALVIEGHCDERGTTEYNIALGERRANAIRDYLARLGVAREHVKTVSYGKEHPVDRGSTEEAWAKNRRGEILLQP